MTAPRTWLGVRRRSSRLGRRTQATQVRKRARARLSARHPRGMEDFSRRVLVALVVAAAGPGAGMLTLLVVGPTLVAASATQSDGSIVAAVAGGLVGLVIGGLLSAGIAYVVAAAETLAAFRTTGC